MLALTACSSNRVDDNSKTSKYCENEIRLFSIQDSMKSIAITYSQESDSIISSIQQELQIDLCWKMVHFGLEISKTAPVKVQLLKECFDGVIRCFRSFPEVSILLNQSGKLMIENNTIAIDSVKFWIYHNFPNEEQYDLEEISIKWTAETPKDSIEKTLINIVDGYLLKYEELSENLFSEAVCDLRESQVDSLSNIFPFKVRLGTGNISVPPPPPPPPVPREKLKE